MIFDFSSKTGAPSLPIDFGVAKFEHSFLVFIGPRPLPPPQQDRRPNRGWEAVLDLSRSSGREHLHPVLRGAVLLCGGQDTRQSVAGRMGRRLRRVGEELK